MRTALVVALLAALVAGKIYFAETFDSTWESRWTASKVKDADGTAGTWKLTAGQWYNDAEEDKGIQTAQDARFYIISAPITEEFTNKDKTLVFQFQVKHEQNIDCGGGYIKLLPKSAFSDPAKFNPDSKYNIMFGPDICGSATRKTHVIFEHEGTNYLVKKEVRCESDQYTHLYTLIVKPDNTYEVRIDGSKVQDGNLEDDLDMVPPKKIQDPQASKPADWVDEAEMDDPADVKPEGYDDIPAKIADKNAKKPEDWDDETDGEWEPPMIDNPEYKGPWRAKMIPNPAYKGPWVHPMIDNPEYKPNANLYAYESFAYVGIEIWQVKAGTIFDNIVVTDSEAEAAEFVKKFEATKKGEKAMYDKVQEEKRQKEEAERKAAEAAKPAEEPAAEPEPEEKEEL
jgi:calreticulin